MWNFEDQSCEGSGKRQPTYPPPPAKYIRQVNDQLAVGIIPKPPKPPSDNQSYEMFGQTYQENNPLIPVLLDAQGFRVEFSEIESTRDQMKMFNMNLLYQFLDLLKKLEKNKPTKDLLEKIEMEFVKLTHLINESRPFMHRIDLIDMLAQQKASTLDEIEKLTDVVKMTVRSLRFHWFPNNLEIREDLLPSNSEHGEACQSEAKCMFCAAFDENEIRKAFQSVE